LIPGRVREVICCLRHVHTGSGAHPAFYPMVTGVFPGQEASAFSNNVIFVLRGHLF